MLVAALMLLACADASAKLLKYTIKCGNEVSSVTYDIRQEGNLVKVILTCGTQKQYQTLDSKYYTIDWRIVDTDTDVTVTRKDGKFHLKGTFNGKPFDRNVEDKGYPWHQHIGVSAGHNLKEGTTTYVCVRPTDLEMFEMQVTPKGVVEFGGGKPVRLKVTPSGALAKLWSCDYYYDPQTLDFFGYKAVEGRPGTPLTTWVLVR